MRISLILIFSLMSTCYAQAQQAFTKPVLQEDSITITGEYKNYHWKEGDAFTVATYDPCTSDENNFYTPIHKDGTFRLRFPLRAAGVLYMDWDRLLEVTMGIPGESFHLVADMNEYPDDSELYDDPDPSKLRKFQQRERKTRISGKYAQLHNEVMRFNWMEAGARPLDNAWKDRIKDEQVMMDTVMAIYRRKMALLAQFNKQKKLQPLAYQFLEASIVYESVNDLTQFQYKMPNEKIFSDGYIRNLRKLARLDDSYGFLSREFMFYIRDMQNQAYRVAVKKQEINGKMMMVARNNDIDSVFNSWFTTPFVKEMVATWKANKELDGSATALTQEQKTAFEKQVSEPVFRNSIYRKNAAIAAATDTVSLAATQLITTAPEFKTSAEVFDYIVQQHKGKVIYMDIWGTWCSPCRAQMTHVPEMKKLLKDKNVVFIYLASSSPEASWKNMIRYYHLTGANVVHYNLPPQAQSLFEKEYLNRGWPTYILVNKEGKMVTKQAPQPEDAAAVLEAVNKLL